MKRPRKGWLLVRNGVYYGCYLRAGRNVRISLKTRDPHMAAARLAIHLATLAEQDALDGAVDRLRAGVELRGIDLITLRRPLVYVWLRDERVLYVGKGEGIGRPMSPAHHRLKLVQPTDKVRILWCQNAAEAELLEARLIAKWQPPLNRGTTGVLSDSDAASMVVEAEPTVEEMAEAIMKLDRFERKRVGIEPIQGVYGCSRAVPRSPLTCSHDE